MYLVALFTVSFAVWWNYISDLIVNVALELLYIHDEGTGVIDRVSDRVGKQVKVFWRCTGSRLHLPILRLRVFPLALDGYKVF